MYRGMEGKIQKAVWTEWCEVEDVSIWWILFSLLSRRLGHLLRWQKGEGRDAIWREWIRLEVTTVFWPDKHVIYWQLKTLLRSFLPVTCTHSLVHKHTTTSTTFPRAPNPAAQMSSNREQINWTIQLTNLALRMNGQLHVSKMWAHEAKKKRCHLTR